MEIHRDRKTVSPSYLDRTRPSLSLLRSPSLLRSLSFFPSFSLARMLLLSLSPSSLSSNFFFFLAAATAFGKTHRISQPGSLLDHQRGMSTTTTSGRPAESLPRQRVSIDLLVRESVNGSEAERAGDPRDRRRDATRRVASHRTASRQIAIAIALEDTRARAHRR